MRLIGHTAGQRDLRQRLRRRFHHLLCPFDPALQDIGIRRLAKTVTKRPAEMTDAEPGDRRQIFCTNSRVKMIFDKTDDPALLPGRKSGSGKRFRSRTNESEPLAGCQQTLRSLQAVAGMVDVIIDALVRFVDQHQQSGCKKAFILWPDGRAFLERLEQIGHGQPHDNGY